jgi:hypothetical protein
MRPIDACRDMPARGRKPETLPQPDGICYRRAVIRPTVGFLLLAYGISGCLTFGEGGAATDDDGGEPTVEPGTYEVEGDTTMNTCGTGSLALADSWSFQVVLKRTSDGISWDVGNGPTDGTLEDDGDFTISSSFVQDMRTEEESWKPACSIMRTDIVKGTLAATEDDTESDDEDALSESFEGSMTYTFEPTEGSDCSDLVIGEERLAAQLPCVARYEVEGNAVVVEEEAEVSE